ncbi:MAG: 3-hydroxyacyl-CoA dehydrogenase family protein [Alphaproteobacteria bacterium]|nr:3-hydroxyacyl-CoA dehydrogenase family protein [Alphaproteobacteria bacterium]
MYPSFDPSRPVAIIGAGVMGTKVAWACARAGLATRLFDSEPGKAAESIERALGWSGGAERERVASHLTAAPSLDAALSRVQLVFENVPEKLALKQAVHGELGRRAPADAYQGSNASSITCTPLAAASGRPERFFNLNFTDPRRERLTELMASASTAAETKTFAMAWARHIGMIPIETHREQLGYSFNRLWRVIKQEALRQIAEGYATPESIDRAWMLCFGTKMGPCGLMDDIGLHTILSVERIYYEASGDPRDRPPEFLEAMVKAGKLGVASGQGFYTHPDPAYRKPGFLEQG